jgi:hypothetical protein
MTYGYNTLYGGPCGELVLTWEDGRKQVIPLRRVISTEAFEPKQEEMDMKKGYSIVEDSHYRQFLKEEGYGFIGQLQRRPKPDGTYDVLPLNRGVELSQEQLQAALQEAQNRRGR